MTGNRHKICYCMKCGLVDLTGKNNICNYCKTNLMASDEYFDEICKNYNFASKDEVEEYVRQNYIYFNDCYDESLLNQREENSKLQNQVDYFEEKYINTSNNTPICPTCGSDNIQRIPTSDKVAGGIMFGLFSSNVRKTMRCFNCGYKW